MTEKVTKYIIIPLLLLVGVFILHSYLPSAINDPDRYYHFAVSRYMLEVGGLFPKVFPSVEDLGWGSYYSDKEFLFHQFSRIGYWLSGDQGVVYITLLLSAASLLLLYFFTLKKLPLWLGLPALVFFFCSPSLLYRMMMVRPHVLAIFSFLGILIAASNKNPRWIFIFSFLFSLSYHAFYVPLICLMIGVVTAFFTVEKQNQSSQFRLYGFGALGLLIGLVVNPYFPSNIISSWQIALIPSLMEGKLRNASFGVELMPLPANEFIRRALPQLIVVFWATFQLGKWETFSKETRSRFLFLYVCTIFTFALACLNRRGAEYFLPAVAVLLVFLLHTSVRWNKTSILIWSVFTIFLGAHSFKFFLDEKSVEIFPLGPASLRAADALPNESIKVYNCDWDRSPYIIYQRPNARVVDILDPSLIFFFNPSVYEVRQQIRDGRVGDVRGLLLEQFKADYVFCVNPAMNAAFLKDPHFEPIFPKADKKNDLRELQPYVFRIIKEKNEHFVRDASVSFYPLRSAKEFRGILRDTPGSEAEDLDLTISHYVNLDGLWKKKNSPIDSKEEQALCSMVRPSRSELQRLKGANFIGLGGGRNLRLWRNGKELFESGVGYPRAAMIQVLVPIDPPLTPMDNIEVMSCSSNTSSYWGVAVSFWKQKELVDQCAEKASVTGSLNLPYNWQYTGILQETCLGPIARTTLDEKLQPARIFP